MKYIIKYTYDWIHLGCDCCCCTDWVSEINVYEEHRVNTGVYTHYASTPTIYDEDDLREYINTECPEFNNFTLHPESYFA